MDQHAFNGLMKVRTLLKQFNIFVYTGSPLDDIVLMDLELDDLFEGKHIDDQEYRELKLHLRRAYREADPEQA